MDLAICGGAVVRHQFHAINSIQFSRANILTSASFTPPPRKSWLQQLFEQLIRIVTQPGKP